MIYKPFGNTGKSVSAIGFGGMRFRTADYENEEFDKCASYVLKAIELGINYFDTAPGYCNGFGERIYGHAFKQIKQHPYISTKCALWHAQDADGARRMIEQSLSRLSVDRITFYNMWCIKSLPEYREFTKKGGIYDGILKAKEEGLIEHICCSVHASGGEISEIVSDGRVEGITLGYNALNFAYRRRGVLAAHNAGLGVVTMNPLGGGMIPRHPELFGFLAKERDESVVSAALKFLIGQAEVNVALVGMFNFEHIRECVKIADGAIPTIGDGEIAEVTKAASEKLNTLCTGCSYCDHCPRGIPVPKLMDAYNELIVTGDMSFVSRRMKDFWELDGNSAGDCVECGACERLCTQHLPIIERLKAMAGV